MKYRLAPLIVFLIVAAAALTVKTGPTYNWDNLFYLGFAEQIRGESIIQAHESAYGQAKAVLPKEDYDKLLSDGSPDDLVRVPAARDPESFRQQIPFYSVKPVFPLLIAACRALGINGVIASFWISAIALGLLAGLCCHWLSRYYSVGISVLMALLIAFSSGVFNLGVDPRPDALYAAAVLATVMLSVRSARLTGPLIALMLLCMLIRPDAVILCLLMCVAWTIIRPGEYVRPAIALILCVALYLGVSRAAGSYSWPTLMYHAYINYLPYPQTLPSRVHAGELVHIYLKFGQPLYSQAFLTMLMVAVLALVATALTSPARTPLVVFSAAIVLTLPLHFLVHPSDNLRVRSAYYIASLVLLLIAVSHAAGAAPIPVRRWLLRDQTRADTA